MKLEPLDDFVQRGLREGHEPPATPGPDYDPSNYGTAKPRIDLAADEQRLSKSEAVNLNRLGMAALLRDLEDWTAMKTAQGFTVYPEPEEGPGTMVWRARR